MFNMVAAIKGYCLKRQPFLQVCQHVLDFLDRLEALVCLHISLGRHLEWLETNSSKYSSRYTCIYRYIYIYICIHRYVDFFNFVSIVYMCIEISIHRYIHIIYIYINKLLAIPRRARSQQLSHRSSSSCGGSGTFTATRTAQGFSLKNGRTYYPLVNQHSEVKNTKFNRFFFAINVPFSRATLNYQRVDIH